MLLMPLLGFPQFLMRVLVLVFGGIILIVSVLLYQESRHRGDAAVDGNDAVRSRNKDQSIDTLSRDFPVLQTVRVRMPDSQAVVSSPVLRSTYSSRDTDSDILERDNLSSFFKK
jgi:hypothetical protein